MLSCLGFGFGLLQIASNVFDYKWSLYGMDADSDEYRAHLSQV